MRRFRHTRDSTSGSLPESNPSWDSSERSQSYYDTSDFNSTRRTNNFDSSGSGTHYTRHASWPTEYAGQFNGAMDSRYSFAGASSTAYAPTWDYVVPTTATSPLAASHSPRMAPTPPSTDAYAADGGPRFRPSQKRPSSPSPQYIDATLGPSTQLSDPTSKPKLLILDLNGTLVYRSPHKRRDRSGRYHDPYGIPLSKRPLRPVHLRPFLSSLRRYMFHPETRKWLDVMIWSSAQPHSVADMVEQCFGDEKDKFALVWARDTLGLTEMEYNSKSQTTKDLAKPWAFLASEERLISECGPPAIDATSSVQSRTIHSAHTTLLIDDSPHKAQLQPWNHMCIKEYVAEMRTADVAAAYKLGQHVEVYSEPKLAGQGSATGKEDEVDVEVEVEQITEESVEEPGGERESDPRKRKRPHKKKLAKERMRMKFSGATNEIQFADETEEVTYHWWHQFDCTLLAVVGVLDAMKWESNVGAWVRKGGLFGSEVKKAEDLAPPSVETAESVDIPYSETRQTQGSVNEDVTGDGDESMRRGLWFDDELTKVYWITRGVKALRQLDIEIDVGIRVS